MIINNYINILPKIGIGREDQCLQCPGGKYCQNYGVVDFTSSNGSGLCHPGYYCKSGVNTPTPSANFTGEFIDYVLVCKKIPSILSTWQTSVTTVKRGNFRLVNNKISATLFYTTRE